MKVSMTLPTMVPGFDRSLALAWCRRIDAGPYHALAAGERVNYWNTELHTTLSFAAAVTERVRIVPTVVVLPAHPVVAVAKAIATLDVLSGGRVTLGVGVGGREEDYRAFERPFRRLHATLDEHVAALRRLWAGEPPWEGSPPVGPAPVQSGGPPILSGSLGPKAIARAARWADGIAGFTLAPDTDDPVATFDAIRQAWADAGRDEQPWLATSFWFSLDGGDVLHRYAVDYLRVFGEDAARAMAGLCTIDSPERLGAALERLVAAGCDEVFLVPTTTDPVVLDRLDPLLAAHT